MGWRAYLGWLRQAGSGRRRALKEREWLQARGCVARGPGHGRRIDVRPTRPRIRRPCWPGKVEVFLDCASWSEFGDGTHVIAETLSRDEAAELLIATVTSIPRLQRALAPSVVERWLDHGAAGPSSRGDVVTVSVTVIEVTEPVIAAPRQLAR